MPQRDPIGEISLFDGGEKLRAVSNPLHLCPPDRQIVVFSHVQASDDRGGGQALPAEAIVQAEADRHQHCGCGEGR